MPDGRTALAEAALTLALFAATPPAPAQPAPASPVRAGVTHRVLAGADAQLILISDAPLERIVALCSGITGAATIAREGDAPPARLAARFTLPVGLLTTGDARRDARFRSGRWLNAADFPEITLSITGLRDAAPAPPDDAPAPGRAYTATLAGELAIRGVTRAVAFPARLTFLAESPETRRKAPGDLVVLRARLSVDLPALGLNDPAISAGLVARTVTADLFLILTTAPPDARAP